MTTPNNSSRRFWANESNPGVAEITAVDTVCYYFSKGWGEDIQKVEEPTVQQPIVNQYVYAKRTPNTVVFKQRVFPTFKEEFNPTTLQFMSWMLKSPTDGTPLVLDVLDTGLNYPMTIRHEESGGTNPTLKQAVGCYCIGVFVDGRFDKPLFVECEFAFQKLEDEGDRSHLTTAPLKAGALSTEVPYQGMPKVVYGVGVDDLELSEVQRVKIWFKQKYTAAPDDIKNLTQTINLYELEVIGIELIAPWHTTDLWDDFIDKVGTKEMSIEFFKPDGTTYIKFAFTNVMYTSYNTRVHQELNYFETVVKLVAEDVQVTGTKQVTTFATHYKGGV